MHDSQRPVSPATVERAILGFLRRHGGSWTGYHSMIYRVAKSLRPETYKNDGTKTAVFRCCGDLLKVRVIFRRKARLGSRSLCRRTDTKKPDEVRLNAVYLSSSFEHANRITQVLEHSLDRHEHGSARSLAQMRPRNVVSYSS